MQKEKMQMIDNSCSLDNYVPEMVDEYVEPRNQTSKPPEHSLLIIEEIEEGKSEEFGSVKN